MLGCWQFGVVTACNQQTCAWGWESTRCLAADMLLRNATVEQLTVRVLRRV